MKQLRAVLFDALCPECKQGRMIKSTMPKKDLKEGVHWRKVPTRCDRCGYAKSTPFKYVGIEAKRKRRGKVKGKND